MTSRHTPLPPRASTSPGLPFPSLSTPEVDNNFPQTALPNHHAWNSSSLKSSKQNRGEKHEARKKGNRNPRNRKGTLSHTSQKCGQHNAVTMSKHLCYYLVGYHQGRSRAVKKQQQCRGRQRSLSCKERLRRLTMCSSDANNKFFCPFLK